jgi:hypothetical protein
MKKLTFVLPAVLLATLAGAHATTVGFSGTPSARTVVDSTATQLSITSLVWVGTFTSESFAYNPSLSIAANVAAIESLGGWNQFSLDTSSGLLDPGASSTLAINGSGKVSGQVIDNNSGATEADFFNGKAIYLWVFNGSTVSGSTEMGIFRAKSGATTPWTYPTNGGGVGDSVTLSTASSITPNISAIGGAGSTSSTNLTLVPEPTTLVTLAGSAAFLGMLRRRRSTRA